MDKLFLPEADREYLEAKCLQFLEVQENGANGLVIENYPLPEGKFTISAAKLLVIIPPGYNDVHPDMFYFTPKLVKVPGNIAPEQTGGAIVFNNETYQQWSRHLTLGGDWRPGIDGIHSYLQKVNYALQTA